MHSIWYDISVLAPELNLTLGALMFLLFGVFVKNNALRYACYSGFALAFASIYHICTSPISKASLFGNMIIFNEYIALFKVLILACAIIIMLILPSLEKTFKYITFETTILIMLSSVGAMTLISSQNLLTLYLSLELMSLPLYIMAAYNRADEFSSEAGLKYFTLGAFASALYLFGAAWLYGFSGSADLEAINQHYVHDIRTLHESTEARVGLLIGMIFVLIALFFKVSAAPFHMWTPDVYQGSPTVVTTFFATLPKVAALALLARMLYGPLQAFLHDMQHAIILVSVLSMVVGSFAGMVQKNLKRMLAYSSIAHVGFALIGLAVDERNGLHGMITYIVIYLSMTMGAFACVLALRKGGIYKDSISDLSGLSKKHPYLAFSIAAIMFSIAGVPPLAGFFAKFYLLYAALECKLYVYAVIAVLTTVVSAFYYLRVVKIMYFDEPKGSVSFDSHAPSLCFVIAVMVLLNLSYISISPYLAQLSEHATHAIFLR